MASSGLGPFLPSDSDNDNTMSSCFHEGEVQTHQCYCVRSPTRKLDTPPHPILLRVGVKVHRIHSDLWSHSWQVYAKFSPWSFWPPNP